MERTESPAAQPRQMAPVALQFTGSAGEYFRIWIVNLCLTVVTLGLYSPWAKVRRKRYFYGSTLLEGAGFEYTGNPVAILKGRLLVVGAFAIYSLAQGTLPLLSVAFTIGALVLLPWIVQRALQFNARNSMHRNIRFAWRGGKMQVFTVLLVAVLLVPVTLGIAYPWYLAMKRRLFVENSAYGAQSFAFTATTGEYYGAALKVLLAFIAFVAGSVLTVGIGLLPFYMLLRGYAETVFARVAWRNTTLGSIRFDCGWTAGGLAWLYVVNAFGVILTLGLLVPWAAIRTARYKLERMTVQAQEGPAKFLAAAAEDFAAVGDEAGELLGFDIGL